VDQQTAAGDAWWELASSSTGQTKIAYQKRSHYWYQQALKQLKGTAKTTVEKRLAALDKALGDLVTGSGRVDKQLVGFYHLAKTKRDNTRSHSVLGLRDDGSVVENQAPLGRWSAQGTNINVVFDNTATGAVRLRSRGKETMIGHQTLPGAGRIAWELTRIDARLLGNWVITYANGAVRTYEFRSDGTVLFVEDNRRSNWIKSGEHYLLDFGDGKIDRIKPGANLIVEHFNPGADLAAGRKPDQIGRGVRAK
jgi:hypothetical protein